MCCSTGVCGPEVDPELPRIAGVLSRLEKAGVKVERFNLTQQPMAFVQNADVRAELDKKGTEALPMFWVDGECLFQGRYPNAGECDELIKCCPTANV